MEKTKLFILESPGTISPGGGGIGTLGFINNFSLSPQSKLRFDIFGPSPEEHDVIAITGSPDLDGDILVRIVYTPTIGDEFTIITANNINYCNFPAHIGIGSTYLFDVICNNTSVKLRVVEEVLSINDFSSEGYEFYVQPNLVFETINVVFNTSEGSNFQSQNLSLTLINILGKEVKSVKYFSEENNIIHRGNLGSGIYFLQLSSEEKVLATTKVIIN